jgi:hypothetical protein
MATSRFSTPHHLNHVPRLMALPSKVRQHRGGGGGIFWLHRPNVASSSDNPSVSLWWGCTS